VTWIEENQRALSRELARVLACLGSGSSGGAEPTSGEGPGCITVEGIVAGFGLSPFERDLLLLLAGCALDTSIAEACAAASGVGPRPTFGLALATLPGAHWSALAPAGPLRRWSLAAVDPGETLTTSPLRIDERVLHHLTGVDYLDQQLTALVAPVAATQPLPPSHAQAARQVTSAWGRDIRVVLVEGLDRETRRAVVASALATDGRRLYAVAAHDLPAEASGRELVARLWEREAVLGGGSLLIELDHDNDPALSRRLNQFVESVGTPLAISAAEPPTLEHVSAVRVQVPRPDAAEQRHLWLETLGERATALNGTLDLLVAQFDLAPHAIAGASSQVDPDGAEMGTALWDACRAQARPRLGELAQRIEPAARWDDLVIPAHQRDQLRQIATHVRGRSRVYGDWGFARRSSRGLGIGALFEGPSGTGKTMAAEVLAQELQLDLYRIDLSQVVSKYIGETEKNLRRVFEAAETGAAILLFDEADALFGKRTEVKDSHDRYANIEVSYLLQRMESYRGLAILTTNAKDALDPAFLRRIRFVVRFPFPDEDERVAIWERIFPPETPTSGLNSRTLARLNLAGGNIRNIALAAAFAAADEGTAVGMSQLARAAQHECLKIGRPLTDTEVGGWI
jgi:hypothetical protein